MQHLKTAPPPLAKRVAIEDQPTMVENFDFQRYRQAIEKVIWQCLEKDPAHRYQSADTLRLDLEVLSKDLVPVPQIIKDQAGGAARGPDSQLVRPSAQL